MQQENTTSLRLKDHQDHHRSTPPHLKHHTSQHTTATQHHNSHPSVVRSAHGSSSSLSSLAASGVSGLSSAPRSSTPNLLSGNVTSERPQQSSQPPAAAFRDSQESHRRHPSRWVPPSQIHSNSEPNNAIFRRTRGILNKLTPDKFEKLTTELVSMIGRDSEDLLKGVLFLIFNKALDEPKYSSMYAQLCRKIDKHLNSDTFRVLLLRKAQSEFGNRRQASEMFEGRVLSQEEEESRGIAKQKMIGNIKFICELGKERLLGDVILHECVQHLLKRKNKNVQELSEDLECLCQIMKTIGAQLDTEQSYNLTKQYFTQIDKYRHDDKLPVRIRFLLRDVVELRDNQWNPVRRVQREKGPAKIQQIRDQAYKEIGIPNPQAYLAANIGVNIPDIGSVGGFNPFQNPGLLPYPVQIPHMGSLLPMPHHPHQPYINQNQTRGPRNTGSPGMTAKRPDSESGIGMASTYCNNFSNSITKTSPTHVSREQPMNKNTHDVTHDIPYHNTENLSVRKSLAPNRPQMDPRFSSDQVVNQGARGHQTKLFNPNPNQFAPNRLSNVSLRSNPNLPPRIIRQLQQQETSRHGQFPDQNHNHPSYSPIHSYGDRITSALPNPVPNKSINTLANLTQGNVTEVSLRPPENSIVSLSNVHQSNRNDLSNPFPPLKSSPSFERKEKVSSTTSPETESPQKPIDPKEASISSLTSVLGVTLDECDTVIEKINNLKIAEEYQSDALLVLMKKYIDQDLLPELITRLSFTSEEFIKAYESLLSELQPLEATVPRTKSHLASLLGHLIENDILSISEASRPLKYGSHYPLFLLTLQHLHKSKGSQWLSEKFSSSQINMLQMVPECDRQKERVADILEDRGLTFLQPLFRVEIQLLNQFHLSKAKTISQPVSAIGGGDGPDNTNGSDPQPLEPPTAGVLWRWIKENVSTQTQKSWNFINILTSCLLKYAQKVASKANTPPETVMGKYDKILLALVHDNLDLQLSLLYALQTHAHSLGFPKGFLLKYFAWFYDSEIVDEETFLKWREDINDDYPGKGDALFQVNQWLTLLEETEAEDEE